MTGCRKICAWPGLLLAAMLLLTGCGSGNAGFSGKNLPEGGGRAAETAEADGALQEASREFFAMDTVMTVRAAGEQAEEAADAAEEEILRLDDLLSVGKEDSEISVLNRERTARVSAETALLIRRAEELRTETEGAFDERMGQLTAVWGFTSHSPRIPGEKEREDLLAAKNQPVKIEEDTVMLPAGSGPDIDLGGIAKGYASSLLMERFRSLGVKSAIVSLGGNVQVLGSRPDGSPWRVGIEDPESEDYLGILSVRDRAVITSGSYERYFEENGKRYHHILDPETGCPAESGLQSVTVICEDGTRADALSTALFVMGQERASAFWKNDDSGLELILLGEDGTLWITEGIRDSFSTDREVTVLHR